MELREEMEPESSPRKNSNSNNNKNNSNSNSNSNINSNSNNVSDMIRGSSSSSVGLRGSTSTPVTRIDDLDLASQVIIYYICLYIASILSILSI